MSEFNWDGEPLTIEYIRAERNRQAREYYQNNESYREYCREYGRQNGYKYIRARNLRQQLNNDNIIVSADYSWIGICAECGDIFIRNNSQKYCESCSIEREEINRGGIFSGWAIAVKSRDSVCQVCGSSHRLEAHHIVPKLQDPSLARNIDNGITLCAKCHREGEGALHRVIGNVYSPEQFAVWFESRKGSLSESLDQWF